MNNSQRLVRDQEHKSPTVSKDKDSLCYEVLKTHSLQNGKAISKENIMGEKEEEHVFDEPEIHYDEPEKYYICWTKDLGAYEFRSYLYSIKGRVPTKEEKDYLIKLFQYMDDQINQLG